MGAMVYSSKFGDVEIRYVALNSELYVSRSDLIEAVRACCTDYVKPVAGMLVDKYMDMFTDSYDSKCAKLSESSIGPVIHFHAAGNLLDTMSDFNYTEDDELIESGRRIRSLFLWLADSSYNASSYFGMTIYDTLGSVSNRLDRYSPPFVVRVIHDGVWIGECDDLGLVTEANSYDELTDRVWEIAPELYAENGLGDSTDGIRIKFIQEQSSESRMAL
ncbi:DUF1902 domain-containing protein [Providencia rettgeri]|uniref:DUF1902 domain-containing protein n=1 Tax=Providencia rettgeri TaxID=587 RepID=UPI001FFBFED6|nr:DUF1902 domain-containing protein [Providencia rettgeri]